MSDAMIQLDGGPSNTVVLFPTNGVGFGHFTRMYALARRLRRRDPDLEVIFFTTMPTLHIPYAEGFPTYHLAGPKKFSGMDGDTWNAMVQEMLTLILETHRPSTFVFDGVMPYRGMLDAIDSLDVPRKIWVRRGMFRKGSSIPVDSIDKFDLVIHPGDAIPHPPPDVQHNTATQFVNAITAFEPDELWSRTAARRRIGVPLDATCVYVQLGAGRINDIHSEVRQVVDALLAHDLVHVVLGESMLGDRLAIDLDRVHLIRDYPNAMYLRAFDRCVQAGGYNSFHEMRAIGLPTLFLPNMQTGMDDQLARCRVAESEGWGIVAIADRSSITRDVEQLLLLEPINRPTSNASNGADQIVDLILN
jgi:UDP:flavonoid glycosyltransferase YjiC (YdhE family)